MRHYLFGLFTITIVLVLSTFNSHAQQEKLLVPVGRIIDQDVYDSHGELIGEVDDIVIKRNGRVKKLIVEYGGFYDISVEHVLPGIGSKLALPYKPLGVTGYGLVYDISLLNLKNIPKYTPQETENN